MASPDRTPLRTRRATVDGVPQRWRESGDGLPVLLLHGFPTSPALWRHVHPLLADEVRAVAWEMTGYGESIPAARRDDPSDDEGEWRDLSLDAQAQRLVAFLDHLGLEEALLVGHDVGGGLAQVAGVRAPDRVAGLVLLNSVAYDNWPAEPVDRIARFGGIVGRLPARVLRPLLWPDWVEAHASPEQARASWDVHWPSYGEHGGASALVREARALDPADTVAIADALPSLAGEANRVVWGARDPHLEPAWGARLAAALDCPFGKVEEASHFVPESHPEAVAAAVLDAAAEVRKGR